MKVRVVQGEEGFEPQAFYPKNGKNYRWETVGEAKTNFEDAQQIAVTFKQKDSSSLGTAVWEG